MVIYFLILGILFLTYFWNRKTVTATSVLSASERRNDKQYAVVAFLCLFVIFGLRAKSVGIDMSEYFREYQMAESLANSNFSNYEKGFYLLNYFFHNVLEAPWQFFVIVTSVIMLLPLVLFIYRYSENMFISLFIFITIGNFTFYMSGLRQSIACSLCLLAYIILDSAKKRKAIAFFISVALVYIAYRFHNSAVVFTVVLLLWIISPKLKKHWLILALIVALLGILLGGPVLEILQPLFPEKYSKFDLDTKFAQNPLLIIMAVVIPLFCLIVDTPEKNGKFSKNMTIFYICSALNLFFVGISIRNNQIGRLQYYFGFSNTILIANCMKKHSIVSKLICLSFIFALCLIAFYMGTDGGWLKIDHFKFFWEVN